MLPLQIELLDSAADLIAIQSEERRRARLVAAGAGQRLDDEIPFELLEIDAARGSSTPCEIRGHGGSTWK